MMIKFKKYFYLHAFILPYSLIDNCILVYSFKYFIYVLRKNYFQGKNSKILRKMDPRKNFLLNLLKKIS